MLHFPIGCSAFGGGNNVGGIGDDGICSSSVEACMGVYGMLMSIVGMTGTGNWQVEQQSWCCWTVFTSIGCSFSGVNMRVMLVVVADICP